MTPTRILVVDDDPKITAFVRRSLEYEGYAVSVAHGGEEGLRLARSERPDAVILDVMMPGLDGFEVCRRLRGESDLPILMLTARDEVPDRVRGLDSGADDYLPKPFALDELLARLRALLRRPRPGAPVLRHAGLILDTGTREARRGGRPLALTAREFDLLALLLRHPRQVLTREIILDRVWGEDFAGDPDVIEVYVAYLRQKLEAEGEPRLIQTVRGVGYTLREGNRE